MSTTHTHMKEKEPLSLPDDIVVQILDHITSGKDLVACRGVCQQWMRMSSQSTAHIHDWLLTIPRKTLFPRVTWQVCVFC